MAFQIKDFRSITASMINWMRSAQKKITDFNVGSVVRTMLEAVAAEIDELYQQMFNGLKEAIPVSVYNSFNFEAIPAIPASGIVQVTIATSTTPVVVSAGTVFTPSSGGVTYRAINNVTIQPGGNVANVAVAATSPGAAGNIPAGETFTLNPPPTNFQSASNEFAFINGKNQESEADRKTRFQDYVKTLQRGINAAIEYGAKTAYLTDSDGNQIERVAYASVDEPWTTDEEQPIGLVNVYIHNGVGSTSDALVTRTTEVIFGYYDADNNPVPGWKAAGVKVVVLKATETGVDVTGTIYALAGYDADDLAGQAEAVIAAYLQQLKIGEKALEAAIKAKVMEIPGVYNITLSEPTSDTAASKSVKLIPGAIAIAAA